MLLETSGKSQATRKKKTLKLDSGHLLITAGVAALATQATASNTDQIHAMGGALAAKQGYVNSPAIASAMQQHSEWHWLPGYKWNSLSNQPYSTAGRVWEAMSGEIGPLFSIFALHQFARSLNLQGVANGDAIADYVWRLGEAVGDYATSDSSSELLWRLFASNIDKIHEPEFASRNRMTKSMFWMAKRTLAYAPMLKSALPEAMRQHVLRSVGLAGVAFETPALNEHFALTFAGSRGASDPSQPQSAYLDLHFVKQPTPFTNPQGRLEQALVNLAKVSRDTNLTQIRFYPTVIGNPKKDGKLALFIRPYFNDQPGNLLRFSADFGSAQDALWWTEALDRGVLQGVYNSDQYTPVKWVNKVSGYGKNLVTPFSDQILEALPSMLTWAASQPSADNDKVKFDQQIHTALEPSEHIFEGDTNALVLPGQPKQSMYHTAIDAGDGFLFIDDYFSQRADLPILTLVTRSQYDDIKPDDLLRLEKHLPWQNYRGADKIASTLLKGQAYSWVVGRLMKARAEELSERSPDSSKYQNLVNDQAVADLLAEEEKKLVPAGETLDSAYDKQKKLVEDQHADTQKAFDQMHKELKVLKNGHDKAERKFEEAQQRELESAEILAAHDKMLAEAKAALPEPGKAKLPELEKQMAIIDKPRGKGKQKAQRAIDAMVDDQDLGLQDIYILLGNGPDLVKNNKQDKAALAKARGALDQHKGAVATKHTAIDDFSGQNEQIAKLTRLEMLKRLSTAHAQGLTLEEPQIQSALTEIQRTAVPEATGFSVIRPVREFLGTVSRAIRPSASVQPQPANPEPTPANPEPTPSNPEGGGSDPQGGGNDGGTPQPE